MSVTPIGVSFEAEDGDTLMRAAQRAGLSWPSVCQGQAQCGTCYAEIVSAAVPPTSPLRTEQALLKVLPPALRERGVMRLACQVKVHGPMQVRRVGVRAPVTKA